MRLAPCLGPGGLRAGLTGLRRALWLRLAIEASILMYVSGKSRRPRPAQWRRLRCSPKLEPRLWNPARTVALRPLPWLF